MGLVESMQAWAGKLPNRGDETIGEQALRNTPGGGHQAWNPPGIDNSEFRNLMDTPPGQREMGWGVMNPIMAYADASQAFADRATEGSPWAAMGNLALAGVEALPLAAGMKAGVKIGTKNVGNALNSMSQWGKRTPEYHTAPADMVDAYHGTPATTITGKTQFRGDVGVHVGTQEQANQRLLAKAADNFDDGFGPNANIHPLKVRLGNQLEMDDIGAWSSPMHLREELEFLPEFNQNPRIMKEFDSIMTEYNKAFMSEGPKPYRDINKRAMSRFNKVLRDEGYDSIKYLNEHENMYGRMTAPRDEFKDVIARREKLILDTWEQNALPRPPALGGKQLTDEGRRKIDFLKKQRNAVLKKAQGDPYSHIMLNPQDIRSRFARFNPERAKSKNPMAGLAVLGATGMTAKQMRENNNGSQ